MLISQSKVTKVGVGLVSSNATECSEQVCMLGRDREHMAGTEVMSNIMNLIQYSISHVTQYLINADFK